MKRFLHSPQNLLFLKRNPEQITLGLCAPVGDLSTELGLPRDDRVAPAPRPPPPPPPPRPPPPPPRPPPPPPPRPPENSRRLACTGLTDALDAKRSSCATRCLMMLSTWDLSVAYLNSSERITAAFGSERRGAINSIIASFVFTEVVLSSNDHLH